ncbi:MAG: prolyl oligopeptidase family serine peptidase, partial [Deltaproteobacteria bacterium]|nr:prolyl oligopeptidase family serine peptidase [Deltaproteobacteria bacterium]
PGTPDEDADSAAEGLDDAVADLPVEDRSESAEDVAATDVPPDGPGDAADATDVPAACPVADDLGRGNHEPRLEFDGRDRSYRLHVPPGYDPAAPTPLVVNLHGLSSNAWQQELFCEMNDTADAHGFVVMYPDGYLNSWNAGLCCGTAATLDIDDVGFLRAAVAHVSERLCIDPRRVYATGMSNGGYMSHRLACEASDLFAAAAPVSGGMGLVSCAPARPMPVLAFHGTADAIVRYDLGHGAYRGWADRNGCAETLARTTHGDSYCETYTDCDGGVEVGFCSLDGMGHCWPGGSRSLCLSYLGPYSDDVDANETMWEFFLRHPRP